MTPMLKLIFVLAIFVTSCAQPKPDDVQEPIEEPLPKPANAQIVAVEDVDWEKLNPARGDSSPQAGTLWGDRKGEVPTGFLAKFVDGFSSPPHIHNATYRAVVIAGLVHNDDPAAAQMWMPAGSFWTQPKGEVHITSAKGETNIALVEIDQGPYLVKPPEEAFDSGERPVNVDVSNIVWVDGEAGTKLANLWRDGESNGTFLKLPAGFNGTIVSNGSVFRAVVIDGKVQHTENPTLNPGSYFGSTEPGAHAVQASDECVLYIRTNASYEIRATK